MLKITEYFPGYFYKKMGKAGKKSRERIGGYCSAISLGNREFKQ
jgi:hypothetical protein